MFATALVFWYYINDKEDITALVIRAFEPRPHIFCSFDLRSPIWAFRRRCMIADAMAQAALPDRSVCRLLVCRVVYCGQTVQDRPMLFMEVEHECEDDISIGTIFDPLSPP